MEQSVTPQRCTDWEPHDPHVETTRLGNVAIQYFPCDGKGFGAAGWNAEPCGILRVHAPHAYQDLTVDVVNLWCTGDPPKGGKDEDG